MSKVLIKNIGILQTPVGSQKQAGMAQGENKKYKDASVLIVDGIIKAIGENGQIPEGVEDITTEIDAMGCLVTPGLVDAHTHLVFGGWRQNELPMKLAGMSYLDILKQGGGILDTVGKTRAASFEELYDKSTELLDQMLALGVTSCEIKSGYGLNFDHELKQLKVIEKLAGEQDLDIVATFMGAHAIPENYKAMENGADKYITYLCEEVIPVVAQSNLAKYCDVFCEDSVFNVEQSRKVLLCGQQHGLKSKIHTDEIVAFGGTNMAGEIGAVSAEHLIAADESGMAALAKAGTIAVLLPQTSFNLDKGYAPAKRMIELGIPVAIASDFNPGSCPSLNLQFAIHLGTSKYKMTPEQVLTAVTINAAAAIGLEEKVGSIEVGKQADLVIWDAPDFDMICYRFGSNLVEAVIKKGQLIV